MTPWGNPDALVQASAFAFVGAPASAGLCDERQVARRLW